MVSSFFSFNKELWNSISREWCSQTTDLDAFESEREREREKEREILDVFSSGFKRRYSRSESLQDASGRVYARI